MFSQRHRMGRVRVPEPTPRGGCEAATVLRFSCRGARPSGVLVLAGLFAAALAVFAVSPAAADNQQVRVEDNGFVVPGVAVKPGESVTWTNPGPAAGTTDVHNVSFEDGVFTRPAAPQRGPWQETRTFTTEGTYLFFCQEHGGAGRQGMSGVVYVNSTGTVPGAPPTASFTTSPSVARIDQNVVFDAAATSDPDDAIVRHEWDLDGNGSYETDTGRISRTALSYSSPGMRTIKLRVTDGQGHTNETTRPLSVTNAPIASFTVSPSPAQTGQMVSFNGSASSDPDGAIAKYEWDLDGNGSYETATGTTSTTSRSYPSPGTLSVRLRVTDNLGVTSETTRPLQVNAAPPPPGGGGGGGGTAPPSNVFSVPRTALTKKGTAILTVRLPGAGTVALNATAKVGRKRIKVGGLKLTVTKAGTYKLTLKPGSAARRVLNKKGRLRTSTKLTFTPRGGAARSSTKTVTLKKTLKRTRSRR